MFSLLAFEDIACSRSGSPSSSAYTAAYGMDGKCTGGTGVAGACAFVTCSNMCFANDPNAMLQATWDCFCKNDKMGANSKCSPIAMQTNTATCLGKLAADMPALNAEGAVEKCIFSTVCGTSCANAGG